MSLSKSLPSLIKFGCLAFFLTTSLVSQAQAGSDKNQGWGKGGKKQYNNTAPTISGVPNGSVAADNPYAFKPSASDADGDTLAFSIQYRPSWASFNSSTGLLSGTPSAGDVGSYSNIRISVSDGTATATLPAFSLSVTSLSVTSLSVTSPSVTSPSVQTGSVSLSWVAPTTRADGTPLSLSELAGYTLYYGSSQGRYTDFIGIDDAYTTSLTITDMPVGTYYFVATVRDANGHESDYSGEVSKQVQ